MSERSLVGTSESIRYGHRVLLRRAGLVEDREHHGDPRGQGRQGRDARGLEQKRVRGDPGSCLLQLSLVTLF